MIVNEFLQALTQMAHHGFGDTDVELKIRGSETKYKIVAQAWVKDKLVLIAEEKS